MGSGIDDGRASVMSGAPDLPDRMRAWVQRAPAELGLEERPMPQPGPGEVLVRVRAAGICGSDLHFWKHAVYGPGVILGHEIAGEVASLGEGVEGLRPGQLGVVYAGIPCGSCPRCREGLSYYCQDGDSLGTGGRFGGLGEYLVAPAVNFLSAPEESDPAVLTFSEPLANGLHCLDQLEVRGAKSALVIGGGPIGLSCLFAARQAGVERVWLVEGRSRRREAAPALGAERVLDPVGDDVAAAVKDAFPQGPELVVEAVGLPETIHSSFRLARPGGFVYLMGVCLGTIEVLPVSWMLKELTIRSSLGCSREDQLRALAWVTGGTPDARSLVTRRVALDEVPGVMSDLAGGSDEIKVVVEHDRC
jgi:threonine dehydrogenase-like Zn-dependent dehydrogenase